MVEAHLILLFDGTGRHAEEHTKSNCRKIYESLASIENESDGIQRPIYYPGIGSSGRTILHRTMSQVRGYGAHDLLFQSYIDVCDFANEQTEVAPKVSIVGFSRGFVIGLVLEKMLHKAGIIDFTKLAKQQDKEALTCAEKMSVVKQIYEEIYLSHSKPSAYDMEAFRAENSLTRQPEFHLFAFDPVASFVNNTAFEPFNNAAQAQSPLELHNSKLPRGTRSCTEIIAKDETRGLYKHLEMEFPPHYDIDHTIIPFDGDHSCIGGGGIQREKYADRAGLIMINFMKYKAGAIFNDDNVTLLFDPVSSEVSFKDKILKAREDLSVAFTSLCSRHVPRQVELRIGNDETTILETFIPDANFDLGT